MKQTHSFKSDGGLIVIVVGPDDVLVRVASNEDVVPHEEAIEMFQAAIDAVVRMQVDS